MRDVRGTVYVRGKGKYWMGCLLDDLRPFGIDANQWMTAAQDEGEWRKTMEQGNVSWRNESLHRKPGMDYGMQCSS